VPVTGPGITSRVRGDKQLIQHLPRHPIFIKSNHPVIVRHEAKAIKPKRSRI
jgi:hypothetical protein